MAKKYSFFICPLLLFLLSCNTNYEDKINIYGWHILSDNVQTGIFTIEASKNYKVNQLQLSHKICNNLSDVKNQWNRNIVNILTQKAHEAGIDEVLVWDHALNNLNNYPTRFKIDELLNLDDPEFWIWFKNDYRSTLDLIPDINGIVLTINDTENKIEEQYSSQIKFPEEKIAAFVDSVASVVVSERNLKLYVRGAVENKKHPDLLFASLALIKTPGLVFMAKEPAIDFGSQLSVSEKIKKIPMPVIIDFDCAHQNEGQGNVASIFPEIHLNRWKYYIKLPNVIGFSIRTDSFDRTSILNRPSEINLFAIYEATQKADIKIDKVIKYYIQKNYDTTVVNHLKPAFELAPEIILSSYYTLGFPSGLNSHPNFDFNPIPNKTVFERWLTNPETTIKNNVNQKFHYWKDLVNRLTPAQNKQPDSEFANIFPEVFDNNWLQPEELMDSTFLNYILIEKQYGIDLALKAIIAINEAKPFCTDSQTFNTIYHTFNRTLLSARLRKAYAQVYYANRIWKRGEEFQDEKLKILVQDGILELQNVSSDIKNYRRKGPVGSYEWEKDADLALELVSEIKKSGILQ
jgi:hypothetical protein